MTVVGFKIAFKGPTPPTLGQVSSMLEAGAGHDIYEAEFAVGELPTFEAEHLVGISDPDRQDR